MEIEGVLTGKQACAALKIHVETLRRMIRSREIDGFISAKTTRVTRASIERLLTGRPT